MDILICESNYVNKFLIKINSMNDTIDNESSYYLHYNLLYNEYKENIDIFFKKFNNIYYQNIIQYKIKNYIQDYWIIQNKLQIYCLLSAQRTGSTLIIDYIQKIFNEQIFALSEIFAHDNTYFESFDLQNKNGKLYHYKHLFEQNNGSYNEYFQQFIQFIESKFIYSKFVFKFTLDYLYDYDLFFKEYENIHHILSDSLILYLNRNEIETYISLKFALKFGFSNIIYPTISNDIFSIKELHLFSSNKHNFEKKIFQELKIYKYIDYEMFNQENHLENISLIKKIFDLKKYDIIYDFNDINKKQNKFSYDQLCDPIYWN